MAIKRSSQDKPIAIWDIDGTMVDTTLEPKDISFDFYFEENFVYIRPGIRECIERISEFYDIAIWTAGMRDYSEMIINHIFPQGFPFAFWWTRERCVSIWEYEEWVGGTVQNYIKDFKKIKAAGYDISRTVIVDNDPRTARRNYGNIIRVKTYEGKDKFNDYEMPMVADYMISIKDEPDFRKIDKRSWRSKVKKPIID